MIVSANWRRERRTTSSMFEVPHKWVARQGALPDSLKEYVPQKSQNRTQNAQESYMKSLFMRFLGSVLCLLWTFPDPLGKAVWTGVSSKSLEFPVAEASYEMIVHHSRRLHVSVADSGAHEREPARLQFLAHRVGFWRPGRHFGKCPELIDAWATVHETPDE